MDGEGKTIRERETFTYILRGFYSKTITIIITFFRILNFLSCLGWQITDNSCHLLRTSSKGFPHIILLNRHTNPLKKVLLSPFFK